MSRVFQQATNEISSDIGIGGNLYVWSLDKQSVIDVCLNIGKSPTSVYFSKQHKCWAIRIKCKRHKDRFYRGVE